MKQEIETEVPTLAVSLKLSGRTVMPPASERVMRKAARQGEFPVFTIDKSSRRPRQYVLVKELETWMEKRGSNG